MTPATNKPAYRRDYGRRGRIGLVTPQANPTAEPEIQLLMPEGVNVLTTRCTSTEKPRQRFLSYLNDLPQTLQSFDTLRLDAIGFACTASSYLVGREAEASLCQKLGQQMNCPVVTAADAILQALRHLGAERIALACPYPDWLHRLAVSFWHDRGFQIMASTTVRPLMDDTRAIYDIRGRDAMQDIIEKLDQFKADVLLITGTGMPSLGILPALQRETGGVVLSSNLCLAWACLQAAGIDTRDRMPDREFPLLAGWDQHLRKL